MDESVGVNACFDAAWHPIADVRTTFLKPIKIGDYAVASFVHCPQKRLAVRNDRQIRLQLRRFLRVDINHDLTGIRGEEIATMSGLRIREPSSDSENKVRVLHRPVALPIAEETAGA